MNPTTTHTMNTNTNPNSTANADNSTNFVAPYRFHFGFPYYRLADVLESLGFPTACADESFLDTVEGFDAEMFDSEFETDARGYETQVTTVSREGLHWIRRYPGAASAAAWILADSALTARMTAALFMKEHAFCARTA